jgi:RNA polymerase sigma-70 factor (ECF subfamily)
MADYRTLTDEQLAGECQAGSLSAFEELVSRHESRLFHFLCQKMRSREDAQDMAQTVLITAWQRIGQYRTQAKFATWLYTIARNLTISHYRKHGRVHLCELECAGEKLVESHTPADALATGEEHDALWRMARSALKNDSYDILWFKYQEGLTIVEIATLMKRSNTAVKVMLHRARKALGRALLAEETAVPAKTPEPLKATEVPELILTNC